MRRRLKQVAERFVSWTGIGELTLRFSGKQVAVLSYHNVVPDDDRPMGDSSLHLPVSRFREHLDVLVETHTVVSFGDLFEREWDESERLAVVTFDDAYRGAIQLGLPELAARRIPGTVFVPPGLLGCDGFWWDRLSQGEEPSVPDPVRRHALEKLGGRQRDILDWAESEALRSWTMPRLYQPVTEEELLASISSFPLVALESHTWSHVYLPAVSEAEAADELQMPREWLGARGHGKDGSVSYPYGGSTRTIEGLASDVGYRAGLLVTGGRVAHASLRGRPFGIPRLNVPRGLTRDGFRARLSGAWVR